MTKRRFGPAAILWISLLLVAVSTLQAAPRQQAAEIASPEREFMGPDGNLLPFKNDAEVMEFMRTARVVGETTIGSGINRSQKVTLEKDGVRAHAIFREADVTQRDAHVGGKFYRVFRDSFLFEPAAYQLALRIGITNIPPAVRRRLSGRAGSMQAWVEDQLDEDREAFRPPSSVAWAAQVRDMILFDNLIFNVDRNGGNILVTSNYTLVMIDHTRGFQDMRGIMDPERLMQVNRDTWEIFRDLPQEDMRDAVRPYLSPREMNALIDRHKTIIQHFEALIEERGEGAVVIP